MRAGGLVLVMMLGCGSDPVPQAPAVPPVGPATVPLSPTDQAIRASMAIRGLRPTAEELDAVRADPSQLPVLVDTWLEDPAFGETIRDMHAELLQLRTDVKLEMQMPSMDVLAGWTGAEIVSSAEEEALKLIELIVTEDRPYTEIVESKTMMANAVIAAAWGLEYDEDGPEWQETTWVDGRPMAGILSSSEFYRRHVSNATNFHRGRARMLTRSLVCDDFALRDLPLEGADLDLADPYVVSDAVLNDPSCAACHQALDGAAAFLWGFHPGGLSGPGIRDAMNAGCVYNAESPDAPPSEKIFSDQCFPLVFYAPSAEDEWADWALRGPSWYGAPGRDLADLGAMIAADPRFSLCTARRFYGYLTQTPTDQVPDEVAYAFQDTLLGSGFSAKALVREIVLSEGFLAAEALTDDAHVPPQQVVRPEQYARVVEQLTGYAWIGVPDEGSCAELCLKHVDLNRSDRYGFRAMSGGIDAFEVIEPTHAATPVKALAMSRYANEAAAWVVASDLAGDTDQLLRTVGPETTDEPTIRAQIVELHADIVGEALAPDDPAVDATLGLYQALLASHDTTTAWTLVVSALLQDPALVFY